MGAAPRQKDVTSFFNDYAGDFEKIYINQDTQPFSHMINKITRQSMYKRFEKCFDLLDKNECKTLLDVGCGPGIHDSIFAKNLPITITGIDVAPKMVELANLNAKNENVGNKCKFMVCDFMEWKPEDKYDASIALGVVEYIMDPVPFLKKMYDSTSKFVAVSLPVKWHLLTPQRAVRYKMRNCPLRFYTESMIKNMVAEINPSSFEIIRLNRDYLLVLKHD